MIDLYKEILAFVFLISFIVYFVYCCVDLYLLNKQAKELKIRRLEQEIVYLKKRISNIEFAYKIQTLINTNKS
jgi:hypothetical protein